MDLYDTMHYWRAYRQSPSRLKLSSFNQLVYSRLPPRMVREGHVTRHETQTPACHSQSNDNPSQPSNPMLYPPIHRPAASSTRCARPWTTSTSGPSSTGTSPGATSCSSPTRRGGLSPRCTHVCLAARPGHFKQADNEHRIHPSKHKRIHRLWTSASPATCRGRHRASRWRTSARWPSAPRR